MSFRPSICSKEHGIAQWELHQKYTFPPLKKSLVFVVIMVIADKVFNNPVLAKVSAGIAIGICIWGMISVLNDMRLTILAKGRLEGSS